MKQGHSIAFLVLAGIAGLAANSLVPRSDEHISMLLRDGRVTDAIAEIGKLSATGPLPPNIQMHLYRAHLTTGKWREARNVLRNHLVRSPADGRALEELVEFDRSVGTEAEVMASLERLLALDPKRAAVQELLSLYRQTSRFEAEAALTHRFADTSLVLPRDLDRAARYFAQAKRPHEAVAVLRSLERTPENFQADHRHSLVEQLLLMGDVAQAVIEAKRSIRWQRGIADAVDFVIMFAEAQNSKAALMLATLSMRRIAGSGRPLACALANAGQPELAENVLAVWGRRIPLHNKREAEAFVEAARDCVSISTLYATLIESLSRTKRPADLTLLQTVASRLGNAALLPLRPMLEDNAILNQAPLLGAELARLEADPVSVRRYAFLAAANGLIADEDAERWSALSVDFGIAHEFFLALRKHASVNGRTDGARRTFALLAAHLGHWQDHHLALARLEPVITK